MSWAHIVLSRLALMAETKGFLCDNPGCGKFEASPTEFPHNWVNLIACVDVPKPEQGFARGESPKVEHRSAKFDLCSYRCLIAFAQARAEALGEVTRSATRGRRSSSNYSAGQLKMQHSKGKHDGMPRENCPLCQGETT